MASDMTASEALGLSFIRWVGVFMWEATKESQLHSEIAGQEQIVLYIRMKGSLRPMTSKGSVVCLSASTLSIQRHIFTSQISARPQTNYSPYPCRPGRLHASHLVIWQGSPGFHYTLIAPMDAYSFRGRLNRALRATVRNRARQAYTYPMEESDSAACMNPVGCRMQAYVPLFAQVCT